MISKFQKKMIFRFFLPLIAEIFFSNKILPRFEFAAFFNFVNKSLFTCGSVQPISLETLDGCLCLFTSSDKNSKLEIGGTKKPCYNQGSDI